MIASTLRKRAAFHLLFSIVSVLFALNAFSQPVAEPRIKVTVFEYAGESELFGVFKAMIWDQLNQLPFEFEGSEFSYLKRLELNFQDQPVPSSVALRETYWRASGSLELLWGAVQRTADARQLSRSFIYLGNLQGNLARPDISIVQELNIEKSTNLIDAYTAVTLYVLALDAQRSGREPSVSIELLTRARNILKNIRRREKSLQRDMQSLDEAINLKLDTVLAGAAG